MAIRGRRSWAAASAAVTWRRWSTALTRCGARARAPAQRRARHQDHGLGRGYLAVGSAPRAAVLAGGDPRRRRGGDPPRQLRGRPCLLGGGDRSGRGQRGPFHRAREPAGRADRRWNQPYRRCFWPFFKWSHRRVRAPLVSSSGTASRRGGKSSAGGRSPVSILLITSCERLALRPLPRGPPAMVCLLGQAVRRLARRRRRPRLLPVRRKQRRGHRDQLHHRTFDR